MKNVARAVFILWLCLLSAAAPGEARVFNLASANTEQVVEGLRALYGDKLQIDVIQQRLVVVGTPAQLAEVDKLLVQLDRPPQPLRLTVSERPPAQEADAVTYSTDREIYSLDTVEGALIALDYSKIAQRPSSNGWLVSIEDVPTEIQSLTLQLQLQNQNAVRVLVSFSRSQNQQRRVYGNTLVGELGTWIALLPQRGATVTVDDGTISSGPKPGSQLYLRVDRMPVKRGQTSTR